MKPSIGRIVHYILTEKDAREVNRRRVAVTNDERWPPGAQAHVGNPVHAGEHVPMIVCFIFVDDDLVNGQVFLDGSDSLWQSSVEEGTGLGTWHWPERIEE